MGRETVYNVVRNTLHIDACFEASSVSCSGIIKGSYTRLSVPYLILINF